MYSYEVRKNLTKREEEVLIYIVAGKNNFEIANNISVSVHTVKAHVSAIFDKMGVCSRVEAAVKALRDGLVK